MVDSRHGRCLLPRGWSASPLAGGASSPAAY